MTTSQGPAVFPSREKKAKLSIGVWVAAVVAVAVCVLWYLIAPASFPFLGKKEASGSFVITLNQTVTDAQGIPFLGTVLYDAAAKTYAYIATNTNGQVIPISHRAFSNGTAYLAMQYGSESNQVVVFDRGTLAIIEEVQDLPLAETVSSAAWAPDGHTFAYLVEGGETPALMVASLGQEAPVASPWFGEPLGFSADSRRMLIDVTPNPIIVNLADDAGTITSGMGERDAETELLLSPSGKYLVAVSATSMTWYVVDWDAATLASLGTVSLKGDASDVLFTANDTLVLRAAGTPTLHTYAYTAEKGIKKGKPVKLALPEGARLLSVVSW